MTRNYTVKSIQFSEGIAAIKNLLRKILKGKPPAFAIFIVRPEDVDERGDMTVKRYVNLADEKQSRTLLSAIDALLEEFRPKSKDG